MAAGPEITKSTILSLSPSLREKKTLKSYIHPQVYIKETETLYPSL